MAQKRACGEQGDVARGSRGFSRLSFVLCRLDETIEAIKCGTLSKATGSPEAKTTLNSGVLVNPRLLQPAPLVSTG